jgi:hypothetical protein
LHWLVPGANQGSQEVSNQQVRTGECLFPNASSSIKKGQVEWIKKTHGT